MYVLGIETSCDNTAIALIYKSNVIYKYNINQNNMLSKYGGYVPHLLSERHSLIIEKLQTTVINNIDKVDYVAVTTGPGIVLSLYLGYKFAKFLEYKFKKKIFYVDHVEAHILSYSFEKQIDYPFICCVISGGHTLIINVVALGKYYLLSKTIDDSVGEVFDKIARVLNLYPQNGEGIQNAAIKGKVLHKIVNTVNVNIKENDNNLSFSGIKTKFIRLIKKQEHSCYDICATLEMFIAKYLVKQLKKIVKQHNLNTNKVVLCGGVANNITIYNFMQHSFNKANLEITRVSSDLACDNAIMIAWTCYKYVNEQHYVQYCYVNNFSQMCGQKVVYSQIDYKKFYTV